MRNRYSDSEVALFVGGPLHGEVREVRPAPRYETVRERRVDWSMSSRSYDPIDMEYEIAGYERQRLIDFDGEPVTVMVCVNPDRFEPRSLLRSMWEVVR